MGPSYSSQTLPNRHRHHNNHHYQPNHQVAKTVGQVKKHDERSIAQSLALIHQHINHLADPQPVSTVSERAAVLAPPPGFSDSESFSDNESLSTCKSQKRYGIKGLPKESRHITMKSALPDQV